MESLPRPEYPRPQLVREEWLNLNGEWEFELDPGDSGEARGLPAGGSLARRILVPFCPESRLSGLGQTDFMPCVWYRRDFSVPAAWEGQRVLLHLGAVDYEATVWVNGMLLGEHRGGYVPFSFDLTDSLQSGENTLVVRARDDHRTGRQPQGKQSSHYYSHGCHYTRTTGIWQTVWLEAAPADRIEKLRLWSDLEQGAIRAQVTVVGEARGLRLVVEASLEGQPVGRAEVAPAAATELEVPLDEVRRWEPGSPTLYDLSLALQTPEGQVVDRVGSYCGLRSVEVDGQRILLNGQPVFQRLVLDQGFYPEGIYTAPDDEALRRDIELAQAMGFNGARLHEKVFEPRFLYWADRLGYLVWGEYPDWGLSRTDRGTLGVMLPEWLAAVERDFSHPCIVGWCPFNETGPPRDAETIRTVYRATKRVDPTRPVIDTSGYTHVETDVYDCHHYTQDPTELRADLAGLAAGGQPWRNFPEQDAPYQGQPILVSEYGGIWWNPGQADDKAWGYGDRPRSEEEFLARYRGLTETLLRHPKVAGFCYTQLYDVEQEVNGLYTYDRRAKFDPELIRAINAQPAAIEGNEAS